MNKNFLAYFVVLLSVNSLLLADKNIDLHDNDHDGDNLEYFEEGYFETNMESDDEVHKKHHEKKESLLKTAQSGVVRSDSGLPTNTSFEGSEKGQKMSSSVINLSPEYNPKTFLKVAQGSDVTCEIDGKLRLDGQFGNRISTLNSLYGNYDSIFIPGRSTLDLGFAFSYGREKFGHDVLELGIDIRNRVTFGQPDNVTTTTKTVINDSVYSLGEHSHKIGVPLLYVRGIDFTLDLGILCGAPTGEQHFFKVGFFPFELGRGIALGSAYAVTPDFITYAPGDVIQEFAPGFMIYGHFDQAKNIGYKGYWGLFKNLSGSLFDVNEPIRTHEYGRLYDPQRGFGIMNFVFAGQIDNILYKNEKKHHRISLSPYAMYLHEGEEIVDYIGDSNINMFTLGFDLSALAPQWEFGIECAKNFGRQNVTGIDKNKINREQRTITIAVGPTTTTFPIFENTNSEVLYTDPSAGADVLNKLAVWQAGSPRQTAIDNSYRDSANNDRYITYSGYTGSSISDIKNSDSRFRDCYYNQLEGWMFVTELTRKFECAAPTKYELSVAFGMASGDENPNKALEELNDHAENDVYEGFVGVQEIYVGKKVKSIFMMSGAGKIARILSVPALKNDDTGEILGFPSRISRFTNLMYMGTGMNFAYTTANFNWKLNPNILLYNQVVPPYIYDSNVSKLLKKDCFASFLGTEINAFFEANSRSIEGLKFFGSATFFIPGQYYSDLKVVPLNKDQKTYMDALAAGNPNATLVPLMGDDIAFYMNCGLEFKF